MEEADDGSPEDGAPPGPVGFPVHAHVVRLSPRLLPCGGTVWIFPWTTASRYSRFRHLSAVRPSQCAAPPSDLHSRAHTYPRGYIRGVTAPRGAAAVI